MKKSKLKDENALSLKERWLPDSKALEKLCEDMYGKPKPSNKVNKNSKNKKRN
ncbi:MAG: hypothetical protein ACK42Z_03555 [Candidatus Kapaibacteriota bacterium]